MSKYCVNCGIQLNDEEAFCHSCGAKQPDNVAMNSEKISTGDYSSSYTSEYSNTYAGEYNSEINSNNIASNAGNGAYSYTSVNNAPFVEDKTDETTSVVKVSKFFLLDLLYAIPGIGFIACIVIAVVAKNKNIANHAVAKLIWVLIGAIISIVVTAILISLFSDAIKYVPSFFY